MFSQAAPSPSDCPGSERNTNCTDEPPQLTAPGSGAEMQFLHHPPSLRHWRQRYLCLVNQNICLPEAPLQVFIYYYYEIRLSRFHYAAQPAWARVYPWVYLQSDQGKSLFVRSPGGGGGATLNSLTLAEGLLRLCFLNHTDRSVNGSRQVGKFNSAFQWNIQSLLIHIFNWEDASQVGKIRCLLR